MDNSKKRLLPLKINLTMVASELGLSDLNQKTQLSTLLQYQQDYSLILRLSGRYKFPGQLVSDGLEEVIDSNGNTNLLTQGSTHWFDSQTDQIELRDLKFLEGSHLSVSSVRVEENDYYTINESQMHPESIRCDFQDVYVDKEEFVDFNEGEHKKIPGWGDPASDQYAPELGLAMQLHQALRIDGLYSNKNTMEDRVYDWIVDKRPDIDPSPTLVTRLSTVVGPGKKQKQARHKKAK